MPHFSCCYFLEKRSGATLTRNCNMDNNLEFALVYPMFFAFAQRDGMTGFASTDGDNEGSAISIFTDIDLGITYIEEFNATSDFKYSLSALNNPHEFIEFLRGAIDDGFTHGLFDPGETGSHRPMFRLKEFINSCAD
jgi:hypothetical protein